MRILIADKDQADVEAIVSALRQEQDQSILAQNGPDALALLEQERFDLLLLDLLDVGQQVDGYEVCRWVRRRHRALPIIMVAARDDATAKIRGLDLGADDYVTKPFSPRELLARVHAVCRRTTSPHQPARESIASRGRLVLYPEAYEVLVDGRPVSLTTLQHHVLRCLALNLGHVVSHDKLLSFAWGPGYAGENALLKVQIHHLRRKLERDARRPEHITTVHGIGYMLNR